MRSRETNAPLSNQGRVLCWGLVARTGVEHEIAAGGGYRLPNVEVMKPDPGDPMPTTTPVLELRMPCELASAHRVRERVGGLEIDGLEDEARERVRIVLSELVANAALHSGQTADDTILVTLAERDGPLRVTVIDDGPGFVPTTEMPNPRQDHGRGIPIVFEYARTMGVTRTDDDATCVWADIPLAA